MIYSERIKQSMNIAYKAHEGQFDKGGYPYIAHPLHLAEQCHTESETIVALLHDVIEDNPRFDSEVRAVTTLVEYAAIRLLSRNKRMVEYSEYIDALAECPLAKKIKLLDIKHNLDDSRAEIQDSLKNRYISAQFKLVDI